MYKNWPQNNGYHTTYRPVSTNGSYYGGYAYRPENKEIRPSLRDLIGRLDEYDNLRLELELHGGRIGQLNALTRLLREPLNVLVNGQSREVRLVDQASLRSAITSLDSDLHLQIRLKPSHMPAYYLCRTKTDYWAEYSLIVEDYYQSPGYPLTDSRFGRLMRAGHEQDFLRLSRFRESVAMLLSLDGGSADDYAVDEKLHLLGASCVPGGLASGPGGRCRLYPALQCSRTRPSCRTTVSVPEWRPLARCAASLMRFCWSFSGRHTLSRPLLICWKPCRR